MCLLLLRDREQAPIALHTSERVVPSVLPPSIVRLQPGRADFARNDEDPAIARHGDSTVDEIQGHYEAQADCVDIERRNPRFSLAELILNLCGEAWNGLRHDTACGHAALNVLHGTARSVQTILRARRWGGRTKPANQDRA